jgi:branched-chain amino acid transport system substrate-binding protein
VRRVSSRGLVAAAAASALLLSACGGDDDSGNGDAAAGGGNSNAACGKAIGFFGALTGSAANLGINIKDGAKLAVDQYNRDNADCKVELKLFDSEGSEDKAPAVATQIINDASVIGVVGPAFSGETDATGDAFNEAGLPTISASATRPSLADQGWKTFHRILGNDASQGPSAGNYIKNTLKATKVFIIDDSSAYGTGLAEEVQKIAGNAAGNDRVQADGQQTDFSATVTKVKSSGADAVFYGGYYQNAGLLVKQMREAGVTAKFVAGDGVKDEGFVAAAGAPAAEGAILTCPCNPPAKVEGTFFADYKAATGREPGTYSAEAFDAANVFLAGVKAAKGDREGMNEFIKTYDGKGITKQVKFDDKGEIEKSNIVVWSYIVKGGKIVEDQDIPQT